MVDVTRRFYACLGKSYPPSAVQEQAFRPLGFKGKFVEDDADLYLDTLRRRPTGAPERKWFDIMVRQLVPGDEVVISEPRVLGGGEIAAGARIRRILSAGAQLIIASMGGEPIKPTPEVMRLVDAMAEAGGLGRKAKDKARRRTMTRTGKKAGRPPLYDARERGLMRKVWITAAEGTVDDVVRACSKAIGRDVSKRHLYRLAEKWPDRGSRPDLIPRTKRKAKRK